MNPSGSPSGLITSRNHPALRRIRDLHTREARDRSGCYLIEKSRFLFQAVQHGARLEQLVVAPEMLRSGTARQLVHRLRRAGTPCLDVTPDVFQSFAQCDDGDGLAAVVRQRWDRLAQVRPTDGLCWIALDYVHSAGNLGTLIRTCEAVGAAGLLFIGESVDPYHPSTVRATMGALFAQRFVRATREELVAWKERHRALLVGTSPAAKRDYHATPYPESTILFMGNERSGLSPEDQAVCDVLVRIPMVGSTDSLNVAVAGSVLLYEVFNQRRSDPGRMYVAGA